MNSPTTRLQKRISELMLEIQTRTAQIDRMVHDNWRDEKAIQRLLREGATVEQLRLFK